MVEGADFLETNSSSSSPWPTDMDMEFVVVECVIFGGGGGGEKGGFPFPRWGKDDDMFLLLLPSTKVDFVTRFAQEDRSIFCKETKQKKKPHARKRGERENIYIVLVL